MEEKNIETVVAKFQITQLTAKRYVFMSKSDIAAMDSPRCYKKRDSSMNKWLNIIFKMMLDNHSNETIYFYISKQEKFGDTNKKLGTYIYLIGKNNFPYRTLFNVNYLMESVLPPNVICFKRREILKYLLTCNPKTKKDEVLGQHIDVIKEKFPIVKQTETIFKEFHEIIMGNDPEEVDTFVQKYGASEISAFCNGIKRDIAPVKNAISLSVSSGFVEGNNNKFKLIKRIVYGRSGLANLEKKCKIAFMPINDEFSLLSLV